MLLLTSHLHYLVAFALFTSVTAIPTSPLRGAISQVLVDIGNQTDMLEDVDGSVAKEQAIYDDLREVLDSLRGFDGPNCGLRPLTVENWEALDIATFGKAELNRYWQNSSNSSEGDFISDYFVPKYFNKAGLEKTRCDGINDCQVDCTDISHHYSDPSIEDADVEKAFLFFQWISTNYDLMRTVPTVTETAMLELVADKDSIVRVFSGYDEEQSRIEQYQASQNLIFETIRAVFLSVFLIGGAIAGPIGGATAAAWGGIVASTYASANSIAGPSLGKPFESGSTKDIFKNAGEQFGHGFSEAFRNSHTTLADNIDKLFKGHTTLGGVTLADLLDAKIALPRPVNVPALEGAALTGLASVAINYLWQSQQTYIMASPSSDCTNDNRGPSPIKVCLDSHPHMVYYVYYHPSTWEHEAFRVETGLPSEKIASPQIASGAMESLTAGKNFHNITLAKIVESSVNYYEKHKNARNISTQDLTELSIDRKLGMVDLAGDLTGTINIPICYSMGGELISSVDSDDSRHFPCMCGHTNPLDVNTWSASADETPEFLKATGFKDSRDWHDFCSVQMKCSSIDSHGNNVATFTHCRPKSGHETQGKWDGKKHSGGDIGYVPYR